MCDQSIAGAEKLDRSYVFILTYGRSGSTLLMSIINSSPECIVRGENGGALYALFESYRRIKEGQIGREMTSQRATSPWWGIAEVSLDEYARDLGQTLTRHIIRPSSEHRICGFKEIRFSQRDAPDLKGYLDFLRTAFPSVKIIFNHRRLEDVSKSKWWAQKPDALQELNAIDQRFREFPSSDSVFHFSYDRCLADRTHVQELFSFLGVTYDVTLLDDVFDTRHSY